MCKYKTIVVCCNQNIWNEMNQICSNHSQAPPLRNPQLLHCRVYQPVALTRTTETEPRNTGATN